MTKQYDKNRNGQKNHNQFGRKEERKRQDGERLNRDERKETEYPSRYEQDFNRQRGELGEMNNCKSCGKKFRHNRNQMDRDDESFCKCDKEDKYNSQGKRYKDLDE